MKKAKLLVGTLVLATMFTGVGYAYWMQDLKIDSTIEMAQFNVYFSDVVAVGVSDEGEIDSSYIRLPNKNTSSSNLSTFISKDGAHINAEKDRATFKVENMYPGSKVRFEATIINDSTIPVKVTPKVTTKHVANTDPEKVNGLLKYLDIKVNEQDVNANKGEVKDQPLNGITLNPKVNIETGDVMTTGADMSIQSGTTSASNTQVVTLTEGGKTTIVIEVTLPKVSNIGDMKTFIKETEKQAVTIDVALDWQQFNWAENKVE